MMTVHTRSDGTYVKLPLNEWKIIVEKLCTIEEISEIDNKKLKGAGILQNYSNKNLIKEEKDAWKESIVEKHANN